MNPWFLAQINDESEALKTFMDPKQGFAELARVYHR